MNTSKFLLAGLAAATLSAAPALLADDTDAQIKAREALQQKVNELNTPPPAPAPTPPPAAPAKPAPAKAAPAPVAKPAPKKPVVQPAPVAPALAAVAAPAAAPASPAPTKSTSQFAPAPATAAISEDSAADRAREKSLQRAMARSGDGFSEVPPPSNIGNATPSQVEMALPPAVVTSTATPPRPGEYPPLPPPPSPLNAAQQAQLAALLGKYQADEITPEQYQTERAKIVGAR